MQVGTLSLPLFVAIKEERFRFSSGYDQVEDVIGVAQPVRFNSQYHCYFDLYSRYCDCEPQRQSFFSYPPQRSARVGGTTTRRRPAATKCTWGARTTGRLWTPVRRSTAHWPPLLPTRSSSSFWRLRWIPTTKSASAETSASEFAMRHRKHLTFLSVLHSTLFSQNFVYSHLPVLFKMYWNFIHEKQMYF